MSKSLRKFFAIGVALASASIASCSIADDTPSYRYRLKVEIETPEGLRAGSSVIEVDTAVSTGIPTPGAVQTRYRGEAVAVDLGERGTLFALMQSNERRDWAAQVMFLLAPSGVNSEGDRFLGRYQNMLKMRQEIALPRLYNASRYERASTGIPTLVTFKDMSDPQSVQRVDPENLAELFGEGVILRTISVQMTDEPVTDRIESHLTWLDEYRRSWLNGNSNVYEDLTVDDLSAHLTAANFDTEYAK